MRSFFHIMKIGPGAFRLILALIVVGFHLSRYVFIGNAAVYAFFILSGYWVSKMYEEKYISVKRGIGIYLVSRMWRIYPIYWLALGCSMLINYALYGSRYWDKIATYHTLEQVHFGLSNFTLLGYCQTTPKFLSPAWSLDIEMQFYLLLPLMIYCIRRVNIRWLLLVSVVLMVCALSYYGRMYRSILKYLPYFLIGIAMAKGMRFDFVRAKVSLWILLAVLGLHFVMPVLYQETVLSKFSMYNVHLNYVLPLIILPYIQHNINIQSKGNDMMYGALSYIVYLFHWVLIIPYLYYYGELSQLQKLPYTVIYLLLLTFISILIYIFFDKKNEKRRKAWVSFVIR